MVTASLGHAKRPAAVNEKPARRQDFSRTRTSISVRAFTLVLLCTTTAGCHNLWMDKTGHLSASVNGVAKSELHDVYALMLTNGYQMKKARSTDMSTQEDWEEVDWGMVGDFVDPNYRTLVVSFMFTQDDNRLLVSCNELHYGQHGFAQRGFSTEGQLRADQVILSMRRMFGDSVKVVGRSNYTGSQ